MRRQPLILLLWLLLAGMARGQGTEPAPAGATATPKALRVAFSASMFGEVPEKDARAALIAWAKTLFQDRGVTVDPKPLVLAGTQAITTALQAGHIDMAVVTADVYFELPRELTHDTMYLGLNSGSTTETYQILVRRDSPYQRLADLQGHDLLLCDNPRMCLANPWLEVTLREQQLPAADHFFRKLTRKSKMSAALLPVFFSTSDACLVSRAGFELMRELNPQVGQTLRVLLRSAGFVPVMFCFRRDSDAQLMATVTSAITELHTSVAGQQMLTIFQTGQVIEAPRTSLQPTEDLVVRHGNLNRPAGAQVHIAAEEAMSK